MGRATLNHIYRVVWSDVQNTWIAVAENSKARGKGAKIKAVTAAVVAALGIMSAVPAYAICTSPNITGSTTGPVLLCGPNGNVTNSGTISGGIVGVVANTVTTSGGVTNSGTISGAGTSGGAVTLRSSSVGNVSNSGVITGASGIALFSSAISGAIVNGAGGTITGTKPTGAGIALWINSTVSSISNSGVITGASGIRIDSSSTVSGAIVNNTGGTISGITYGILVGSSSAVNGGITNSGRISGSDPSGSAAGIGINTGSVNGNIVNSGVITASGSASSWAAGMNIASSSVNGSIVNSGVITASGGSRSVAGVWVGSSSLVTGSITNSGTISGGTYGIWVGSSSAVNGGITNSGTISGGNYSINVDSRSTVGSINNQAGGVLSGNLYVGDAAATVTNAGTISLPETATATISGNYTQTSTGLLQVGASSASSYGKLVVSGTATLPAAAKLGVDVNTVNTLAKGDVLAGVLTAGTLNASTFTVSDNSSMFNFTAAINGNAVDLTTTTGQSAVSSAAATGNTVAQGIATIIDGIVNGSITSTGASGLVTALGQLGTQQQVSDALNQLLPLLQGSSDQAVQNVVADIKQIIEFEGGGAGSGDSYLSDKHIWVKPFGSKARQNDRNGVSGYKSGSGGLVIGADGELAGGSRLGLAFSYAQSSVTGNSAIAPQSAGIDSYQATVYGSRKLSGTDSVDYQFDIGRHNNRGQRFIPLLGLLASSSYNSLSVHAGAGWKHAMALNEATTLTPTVRADYTTLRDDGYSETGAGAANLTVGSRSADQFIVTGGGKISHAMNDATRLKANLGVGYDLINKQASVTSALAGAPTAAFTTYGLNRSAWLGTAGVGIEHTTGSGMKLIGRYDVESRSGLTNQTLSAKARWAF